MSTAYEAGERRGNKGNADRLRYILEEPALRSLFREFLRGNFCEENLSFWLDVQDFKRKFNITSSAQAVNPHSRSGSKTTPGQAAMERHHESLIHTAFVIYNTYLAPSSQCELNIDHGLRNELAKYLEEVVTGLSGKGFQGRVEPEQASAFNATQLHTMIRLYERIQTHVFRLMATDSVPKVSHKLLSYLLSLTLIYLLSSSPPPNSSQWGTGLRTSSPRSEISTCSPRDQVHPLDWAQKSLAEHTSLYRSRPQNANIARRRWKNSYNSYKARHHTNHDLIELEKNLFGFLHLMHGSYGLHFFLRLSQWLPAHLFLFIFLFLRISPLFDQQFFLYCFFFFFFGDNHLIIYILTQWAFVSCACPFSLTHNQDLVQIVLAFCSSHLFSLFSYHCPYPFRHHLLHSATRGFLYIPLVSTQPTKAISLTHCNT